MRHRGLRKSAKRKVEQVKRMAGKKAKKVNTNQEQADPAFDW